TPGAGTNSRSSNLGNAARPQHRNRPKGCAPDCPASAPGRTFGPAQGRYPRVLRGVRAMPWFIGRTEAMSNPEAARGKALERLRGLAELDDPGNLVGAVLVDASVIGGA